MYEFVQVVRGGRRSAARGPSSAREATWTWRTTELWSVCLRPSRRLAAGSSTRMARAAAEALEPLPASGVRIVEAATVICVRRAPAGQAAPRTLHHGDYELDADGTKQLGKFHWSFSSGLQVLMGQSEVINWVRSAPEKTSYMRYAGEWKFPGGSVDSGETLATTAVRELSEEFRVTVPANAVMEPFNVKFTRAIQGKSFTMFNFLCAADENPWLQHLDLDVVNASLSSRRQKFDALLESGDFWKLNKAERMEVSPEVHRVEWLDLSAAVEVRLSLCLRLFARLCASAFCYTILSLPCMSVQAPICVDSAGSDHIDAPVIIQP